jgi:hypothetical protein
MTSFEFSIHHDLTHLVTHAPSETCPDGSSFLILSLRLLHDLLGDIEAFEPCWHSAVDGDLEQRLSKFNLSRTIVEGPTHMGP